MEYPDNRKKFAGRKPSDFTPGTPKFDNPVKRTDVVYSRPAIRGQRGAFRQTTAPKPPEPAPEPVAPPVEPVPTNWEFDDTKGTTADKDKMGDL